MIWLIKSLHKSLHKDYLGRYLGYGILQGQNELTSAKVFTFAPRTIVLLSKQNFIKKILMKSFATFFLNIYICLNILDVLC